MANGKENDLTSEAKSSIILTSDETRIITNLRRYAKMYPFADLAILLKVHNGLIKDGLLCLGKGADSNIKL